MAAERSGGVGFRFLDDWDLGAGAAVVVEVVALLLVVLGVRASRENSLGVLGWEEEEPKRERAHFVVSPSLSEGGDTVVEREVLEEDCERLEVSSAPEEVTS